MVILEILVLLGKRLGDLKVFLFRKEIQVFYTVSSLDPRVDDHVSFVINDGIKLLCRKS